ncbi:MAG: hypothetical protein M3483_08240, partial [Gemmatimonadota bacterium]|nr:hypothetical protein [Gemmatimonadota bacterium]
MTYPTEPTDLSTALRSLRNLATVAPGVWHAADTDERGMAVSWLRDAISGAESLRIERRLIAPFSVDLADAAAALPGDLEIGEMMVDRSRREVVLQLRAITGRRPAERCTRCGSSPRFGTSLYGDAQLCAVCAMNPRETGKFRGSTLIMALLLVISLGIITSGTIVVASALERAHFARWAHSEADAAAEAALEVMTERLRAAAQEALGQLTPEDLVRLDAEVGSLPAYARATLQMEETGFRLVSVRDGTLVPEDVRPLDLWTDHPRVRYSSVPRPQGLVAYRTLEIEMRARAAGDRGVRRTVTRSLKISRLMPHQHVLYHSGGTAEVCGGQSQRNAIGGPVRVDGQLRLLACEHPVEYAMTLEARDGIDSQAPSRHLLHTPEGALPIQSWSRAAVRQRPSLLLASTMGHLRIPPAWGGGFEESRLQVGEIAGSGECADRAAACGGSGFFSPSVAIEHTAAGVTIRCGEAYESSADCVPGISAALRYHAYPFTSAPPAGLAIADPGRPHRFWRGLFPDGRREARCINPAAPPAEAMTHRCPTNPFGFVL